MAMYENIQNSSRSSSSSLHHCAQKASWHSYWNRIWVRVYAGKLKTLIRTLMLCGRDLTRSMALCIDCILSDIKNLPNCDDSASTLDMIRLVETAHSDLQCIDALSELQNAMIISIFERRMSSLMLDEWAKLVSGKQLASEAKLSKLISFLHKCKRMIEYENADIRMPTVQSDATNYRSPPSATARRCLVHRNHEHPILRFVPSVRCQSRNALV